jgi:hypothetical protein
MKRLVAAMTVAIALMATAPVVAHADPVDDARRQVADNYNKKLDCDAAKPILCPGPLP